MPPAQVLSRVLVVDDERIIADSLALILRGRGFESRSAYSGEEAAEIAQTWQPDAVISDVVMGKMDGVALAVYLAQSLPSCRVLLISGNPDAEQLMNASKNLGYEFPILPKPFHPESLFEFLFPGGTGAGGSEPVQVEVPAQADRTNDTSTVWCARRENGPGEALGGVAEKVQHDRGRISC